MRLVDADDMKKHIKGNNNDGIKTIMEWIDNQSTIDPMEWWIPCCDRRPEHPCLACDTFGQIFIPHGVVTVDGQSYDADGFDFDFEKFLRGRETVIDGEPAYILPREIIAWRPLPKPYKEERNNEQSGMQAGVPAAQTGDGGGDKQEGSAEGGGDLQAEAIRSSERPAETEENR